MMVTGNSTAGNTSNRKFPSDRDIALAAAILQSKPDNVPVREYLTLLCQHIAKGRRENALSTVYRHLDRSSFWRSQYDQMNASRQAAEARETDVLREVELLKAKVEVMKSSPAKKKRADPDVVMYPRSPKKRMREVSPPRGLVCGGVLDDEVASDAGDESSRELMRCLFRLDACLKPGVRVNIHRIATEVITASAEVQNTVIRAVRDELTVSEPDLSALKAALTATGRVSAALLVGYTRLCKHDEKAALQGQTTHAMAQMYGKLLQALQAASASSTASVTGPAMSASPSKASKTKQNSPQKSTPRVLVKDDPIMNAITSLLISLLKQLDVKYDCHKELYEGYLFCIISALGDRLHTIVFHRPRGATISEDIAAPMPDPEHENTTFQPEAPDSLPIRQARLEAPYLLHLLKHALAIAPTFFGKLAKGGKPSTKPGVATKSSIALLAKERLQRTLVNAIFGTEGVAEESDMLTECLRMPVFRGAGITAPRVKETEVCEWFKEEVWRLLGWEVLGKELDA